MKQPTSDSIVNQSMSLEDIKLELGKKKFQCQECMKYFSSNQSLKEHQFLHTKARPYTCNLCGKSFRYGSQLCIHRRTHSITVDIKCLKLTDLILNNTEQDQSLVLLQELVKLPPLKDQQVSSLPAFSSVFRGYN